MDKEITEILEQIEKDTVLTGAADTCERHASHLNVSGLVEENKGYIAAALARRKAKKPVIIVPDPPRARQMALKIAPFTEGETVVLMPSELSLITAIASSRENECLRAGAIDRIMRSSFGAAIICAAALTDRMQKKEEREKLDIAFGLGDTADRGELIDRLTLMGYERVNTVSSPGEFASRGDVVDIFSPDREKPVRIGFFDDEVDQIKIFDRESQRSEDSLRSITVCPATEYIIDRGQRSSLAARMLAVSDEDIAHMKRNSETKVAELLSRTSLSDSEAVKNGVRISGMGRWLSLLYEDPDTILDYINRTECMIFVDELAECVSRIDGYHADFLARCTDAFHRGNAPHTAAESFIPRPEVMKRLDRIRKVTSLSCLSASGNGLPRAENVRVESLSSRHWHGREEELANNIRLRYGDGCVRFFLTGGTRIENLRKNLTDLGVVPKIIGRPLPAGFCCPGIGLMVIGETDVFDSRKNTRPERRGANRIGHYTDIKPGDYVVHDVHGIGLYTGIVNLRMGSSCRDYLKVIYAKNACIYIPTDKLDRLSRYIGPANKEPKLSKLDSPEWGKSVDKARSSIKKLAFDLVALYAKRKSGKGYSCGPDDSWQKEFEENFPYLETRDQLQAIKDIKKDMESELPMDRLLCGDVGFGKTEVAFRAMFKCVTNGRQAFMLAPTTLLAKQHYDKFRERIGSFPIRVAMLSRLVPNATLKEYIRDIKDGRIDVVIGTHRILSKDVVPHKLGLLVVDEEQRFGVNHKEKIKAMRSDIDVLTLTATPIPRTLHMSMTGIRDISVLDDPPLNRRPVETYVIEYDEEIIMQACMREIARGGQIFYLYNRTADIEKKAEELREMMPDVRIVYAHGKMSEHQMEDIISGFIEGEADILVCTTIIESGVDMPNVNTMIVEDSDRFGLSQLYQIKGRVGRSDRQAFAYLTYRPEKEISSDAAKRLIAIREFTELGSGIKVALRDLEVRGAGNLLGAEQHGQMEAIGYELYCRILDEEVRKLRDGQEDGEVQKEEPEAQLEVDFDSYIPVDYIDDDVIRMSVYRRIGEIRTQKDHDDFIDEITDRYGDPPREVVFLAGAALIRSLASSAGFGRVKFADNGVLLYFDRKINEEAVADLIRDPKFNGRILVTIQGEPYIHYMPPSSISSQIVGEVIEILGILSGR